MPTKSLCLMTEYRWAFPSEIPTLNFVDSDMLIYADVMKWVAGKK